MTVHDPMKFHRWALCLARRYGGMDMLLLPEDCYQVAMIGLLELWRTKPDADDATCLRAMRWAVTNEIRRLMRRRIQAEAMDEAMPLPAPGDTADQAIARITISMVKERLHELPDKEFVAVGLVLMGATIAQAERDMGVRAGAMNWYLWRARQRMRQWIGEVAG